MGERFVAIHYIASRKHIWMSTILGSVGPGAGTWIAEQFWNWSTVAALPVWVAILGGLVTAVGLLVRELETLDQVIRAADLSEDPRRPTSPRSPEELVYMVRDLTDSQRRNILRDQIGLWMKVQGRIEDIRSPQYIKEVTVTLQLPSGVTVHLESKSRLWRQKALASRKDDIFAAFGKIDNALGGGYGSVDLDNCDWRQPSDEEWLPP